MRRLYLGLGISCLALSVLSSVVLKPELTEAKPKSAVQPSHRLSAKSPRTIAPAQLEVFPGSAPGIQITPLITTGDILPNGYQMAGIPDGLGAYKSSPGAFTVLMNHELTAPSNLSDSRVSKITFDLKTLQPKIGSYLVKGIEGFKRFCSATLVGPIDGFSTRFFLTGEEAANGRAVAINTKTGQTNVMPWLGLFGHENVTSVKGYGTKKVLLSTDDNAPGHIYMYIADSEADLFAGNGQLYVFKADGITTPTQLKAAGTGGATGTFVPIDQADNTSDAALRASALAKGAMIFVRPEDMANDRDDSKTLYFNTTGRKTYNSGEDAQGRIHKMVLDPTDPTKVNGLTILADGNDPGVELISPDNIAASDKGLMINEDINADSNTVPPRAGRVIFYDFATKSLTPVAQTTHKDSLGNPVGTLGDWETSGVIDVSDIFGPDTWMLDVQSHSLRAAQFRGTDESGQLLLLKVPGSASR